MSEATGVAETVVAPRKGKDKPVTPSIPDSGKESKGDGQRFGSGYAKDPETAQNARQALENITKAKEAGAMLSAANADTTKDNPRTPLVPRGASAVDAAAIKKNATNAATAGEDKKGPTGAGARAKLY